MSQRARVGQGIDRIWPDGRPLIGMVHLLPLPGSPRWGGSMDEVLDRARSDALAIRAGGMDGVLVENFLDAPFHRDSVEPVTIAAMTRAVSAVVAAVVAETELPTGVNVLRNDARAALAIASVCGAAFVRVNVHTGAMWTDQGLIEGRAAETLRARRALDADVVVLADVLVKHAVPPAGLTLEEAAADTWNRGLADALIVSGRATGSETDTQDIDRVKRTLPDARTLVGSGVREETVARLLRAADGAIVGSALTDQGRAGTGVDIDRVRALVEAAARA